MLFAVDERNQRHALKGCQFQSEIFHVCTNIRVATSLWNISYLHVFPLFLWNIGGCLLTPCDIFEYLVMSKRLSVFRPVPP